MGKHGASTGHEDEVGSFLKKRTKKLLSVWVRAAGGGRTILPACLALVSVPAIGHATSIKPLYRFAYSTAVPSSYPAGRSPQAELMQAADGNFYGTATDGGAGACPDPFGGGSIIGCGTVFRMTPQGKVTVLYAFPYDSSTSTAPDGAYPTAGLIQGQDGFLYGVASDGGVRSSCNGALGCGTLFRISTAGAFTLLHQFCSGDGCANPTEGGLPVAHLVQTPAGALCGTTQQGGIGNDGTVFCATTAGSVSTLYAFNHTNGTDGDQLDGALLVGADGETLYGTTAFGGAKGGGIVFAYRAGAISVLHAFDSGSSTPGTGANPECALIFGADGKLYGTTYTGATGGVIFRLRTNGTDFASHAVFSPEIAGQGFEATSGLVLASNGLMYGTTYAGGTGGDNGSAYSYNPKSGAAKSPLVSFNGNTGAGPRAALIEGKDGYLYGTTTLYGNSAHDQGSLFRIAPALPGQ